MFEPGDLVVLDNLYSYKSSAAIAAGEAVGAKMIYLPLYLSLIESGRDAFSEIKQLIRCICLANWREIIQSARHALLHITRDDID